MRVLVYERLGDIYVYLINRGEILRPCFDPGNVLVYRNYLLALAFYIVFFQLLEKRFFNFERLSDVRLYFGHEILPWGSAAQVSLALCERLQLSPFLPHIFLVH